MNNSAKIRAKKIYEKNHAFVIQLSKSKRFVYSLSKNIISTANHLTGAKLFGSGSSRTEAIDIILLLNKRKIDYRIIPLSTAGITFLNLLDFEDWEISIRKLYENLDDIINAVTKTPINI